MFGYSMVQMVRNHSTKLDAALRDEVLNFYKPFKWTPCFMHNMYEGVLKKTKKLPVIIEFEQDCFEQGLLEVNQLVQKKMNCKMKTRFTRVSCCSADVTPDALEEMLGSCQHIRKIYLNREVKALLNTAVSAANAETVIRNGTELTGRGVTVAIIDTGIHPHQDLEGRIIDFVDFINDRIEPYDDNGHGTHCAGDAVGNGSGSQGLYKGPASEANVIGVKVLNKIGSGSLETVMQGVEWCMDYNDANPDQPIDIISMSLGAPAQRYEQENDDPMVQMVERAWEVGMVVCVAAGNEGPSRQTIASPGISSKVITVGALDDRNTETREDDEVASFSSRGPTIYGVEKPDILAPGVSITSLRSPNSYIDKLQKGSRVGSSYFVMSGTSMATPICAGIVALMLEHDPNLSPEEVKQLLMSGADLWRNRDPNVYGAGYLNAENSVPE